MFEYSVASKNTEKANQMIKQISVDKSELTYSLISPKVLKQFYDQSLKNDNFDGVSFCIANTFVARLYDGLS